MMLVKPVTAWTEGDVSTVICEKFGEEGAKGIQGMKLNGAGLLRLDNTAIRSIFPEKVQWRLRQRFARFRDSLKESVSTDNLTDGPDTTDATSKDATQTVLDVSRKSDVLEVYSDEITADANHFGEFNTETLNHLIRSQVLLMMQSARDAGYQYPTDEDLVGVAQKIIRSYPSLADQHNPNIPHAPKYLSILGNLMLMLSTIKMVTQTCGSALDRLTESRKRSYGEDVECLSAKRLATAKMMGDSHDGMPKYTDNYRDIEIGSPRSRKHQPTMDEDDDTMDQNDDAMDSLESLTIFNVEEEVKETFICLARHLDVTLAKLLFLLLETYRIRNNQSDCLVQTECTKITHEEDIVLDAVPEDNVSLIDVTPTNNEHLVKHEESCELHREDYKSEPKCDENANINPNMVEEDVNSLTEIKGDIDVPNRTPVHDRDRDAVPLLAPSRLPPIHSNREAIIENLQQNTTLNNSMEDKLFSVAGTEQNPINLELLNSSSEVIQSDELPLQSAHPMSDLRKEGSSEIRVELNNQQQPKNHGTSKQLTATQSDILKNIVCNNRLIAPKPVILNPVVNPIVPITREVENNAVSTSSQIVPNSNQNLSNLLLLTPNFTFTNVNPTKENQQNTMNLTALNTIPSTQTIFVNDAIPSQTPLVTNNTMVLNEGQCNSVLNQTQSVVLPNQIIINKNTSAHTLMTPNQMMTFGNVNGNPITHEPIVPVDINNGLSTHEPSTPSNSEICNPVSEAPCQIAVQGKTLQHMKSHVSEPCTVMSKDQNGSCHLTLTPTRCHEVATKMGSKIDVTTASNNDEVDIQCNTNSKPTNVVLTDDAIHQQRNNSNPSVEQSISGAFKTKDAGTNSTEVVCNQMSGLANVGGSTTTTVPNVLNSTSVLNHIEPNLQKINDSEIDTCVAQKPDQIVTRTDARCNIPPPSDDFSTPAKSNPLAEFSYPEQTIDINMMREVCESKEANINQTDASSSVSCTEPSDAGILCLTSSNQGIHDGGITSPIIKAPPCITDVEDSLESSAPFNQQSHPSSSNVPYNSPSNVQNHPSTSSSSVQYPPSPSSSSALYPIYQLPGYCPGVQLSAQDLSTILRKQQLLIVSTNEERHNRSGISKRALNRIAERLVDRYPQLRDPLHTRKPRAPTYTIAASKMWRGISNLMKRRSSNVGAVHIANDPCPSIEDVLSDDDDDDDNDGLGSHITENHGASSYYGIHYPIYHDAAAELASQKGFKDSSDLASLVRGQVNLMFYIADKWNRKPTTYECGKVAERMVQKYPALRDGGRLPGDKNFKSVYTRLRKCLNNRMSHRARKVKKQSARRSGAADSNLNNTQHHVTGAQGLQRLTVAELEEVQRLIEQSAAAPESRTISECELSKTQTFIATEPTNNHGPTPSDLPEVLGLKTSVSAPENITNITQNKLKSTKQISSETQASTKKVK